MTRRYPDLGQLKKKTPGSRALEKACMDLEWGARVLNVSAVPSAVDIVKLVDSIQKACALRLSERASE